jgi:hypothetical protein
LLLWVSRTAARGARPAKGETTVLTNHQRRVAALTLSIATLNLAACTGEVTTPSPARAPEIEPAITRHRTALTMAEQAVSLAKQKIVEVASDHDRWHSILRTCFGDDFNYWDGEYYRNYYIHQPDLLGQPVRLIGPEVLGDNLGAHVHTTDANGQLASFILINNTIEEPAAAANVIIEERGHELDLLLNEKKGRPDSRGDEGHIFRNLIVGEEMADIDLEELRNHDDSGWITYEGRQYRAEFLFGTLARAVKKTWNGIRSGAGWAWRGAKTAGDALDKAAKATWDGATTLGGWIEKGAKVAADKYVEALRRDFWGAYHALQLYANTLWDAGLNSYDAFKMMKDGIVEIGKGNLVDGATAMVVALVKAGVEVPASSIVTAAADAISTLQTIMFLEPEGRFLTDNERSYLGWVFYQNDWWFDLVRVKEGFCGVWDLFSDRALTIETNIYLKDRPATETRMAHEMTHVWQWIHGGGDYKIYALHAQNFGDGYDWRPAVAAGKSWAELNPEQQGRFVDDAYGSNCYAFAGPCTIGQDVDAFFRHVDQQIMSGAGAP